MLQIELEQAHEYYRKAVAICLKITFYAAVVFAAVAGAYITLYNGSHIRVINPETGKLWNQVVPDNATARSFVALFGLVSAVFFYEAQNVSLKVFYSIRDNYLLYSREQAGLPRLPPTVDENFREESNSGVLRLLFYAHIINIMIYFIAAFVVQYKETFSLILKPFWLLWQLWVCALRAKYCVM